MEGKEEERFCFTLLLVEQSTMQLESDKLLDLSINHRISNLNKYLHDEVFLIFQPHPSEMLVWAETQMVLLIIK